MDHNAFLEIIREHLLFIKWFAGGIGAAIGAAAVALYYTVLVPMKTSYCDSNTKINLTLSRIADAHDSTREHVKELKEKASCKFQAPPVLQPKPA